MASLGWKGLKTPVEMALPNFWQGARQMTKYIPNAIFNVLPSPSLFR
jgi:hypothetical protein